jgi:hypothetical protein
VPGPDVACAFYGDVFFKEGARSADAPPWDEYDVDEDLETESLEPWWPSLEGGRSGRCPASASTARRALSVLATRARCTSGASGPAPREHPRGQSEHFLLRGAHVLPGRRDQ